ncbi:MAG TPA: hypothetical protein VFH36_19145 [Acidimicrobiales bacterium]|nr:hypothetical protein [Acidimicrobiales bacterium]
MERRKAVIAAATASLTLLAGAAAISLNTSLVGASGNDGVGQVSPVDPTTIPSTIYIDEPAAPQTRPSTPSRSGDDVFDGEDERDEDDHGDDPAGYVDDDHEYEGADDDD